MSEFFIFFKELLATPGGLVLLGSFLDSFMCCATLLMISCLPAGYHRNSIVYASSISKNILLFFLFGSHRLLITFGNFVRFHCVELLGDCVYEHVFKNNHPFLGRLTTICGLNDPSNFYSMKVQVDDIENKLFNSGIIRKKSSYGNYKDHFINTEISLIQKLLTAFIGVTFIPYTLSIKKIGILTYSWEDCLYEFIGFLIADRCYRFIINDPDLSERALKEIKCILGSIIDDSENVKAMILLSKIYLHEDNYKRSLFWADKAFTKNETFKHTSFAEYFLNEEDIRELDPTICPPIAGYLLNDRDIQELNPIYTPIVLEALPGQEINRQYIEEINRRLREEFYRRLREELNRQLREELNRQLREEFNRQDREEFNRQNREEFNRQDREEFNRQDREEFYRQDREEFNRRAPAPSPRITTTSTRTGGGEPTTSEISEDITWDDADYFPHSYENAESSSSYLNQNVQTNNETIRLRYNRLLSTMAGLGQSARDIPERLNRNNGSTRLQEYNIDGNAESSSSYSNQDVQANNETSGLQLQYNRFSSTIAGLGQSARDIPERLNRNNETTKFQEYNRFLSNDSE